MAQSENTNLSRKINVAGAIYGTLHHIDNIYKHMMTRVSANGLQHSHRRIVQFSLITLCHIANHRCSKHLSFYLLELINGLGIVVISISKQNTSDKSSLRLTRRSGSAGVTGSNFDFIVLFDLLFCKPYTL